MVVFFLILFSLFSQVVLSLFLLNFFHYFIFNACYFYCLVILTALVIFTVPCYICRISLFLLSYSLLVRLFSHPVLLFSVSFFPILVTLVNSQFYFLLFFFFSMFSYFHSYFNLFSCYFHCPRYFHCLSLFCSFHCPLHFQYLSYFQCLLVMFNLFF